MTPIRRRRLLAALGAALTSPRLLARSATELLGPEPFAEVRPGYRLRFPYDHGSHPAFRLEWWYVTGWLRPDAPRPLGFQLTFFRVRTRLTNDNPSAFTPRHILIAHAALSDPERGRLMHAERAARAGFGLAEAEEGRTRVRIDEWSLTQHESGYRALISWNEARFDFILTPRQTLLLQGQHGYSRKGPAPLSASYYYSQPHLAVTGTLERHRHTESVAGTAWLDHEWSSQYLDEQAVGWDWIGINLDDGAALMLFRMRDREGSAFWAGGTLRHAQGRERVFAPAEVSFTPTREWRSPRTGARYPIAWTIEAGGERLAIEPLMEDQEHDTRATTGTIYWEGAVHARRGERIIGRGYLELTGYWRRISLARSDLNPASPRSA